jgi:hypothetical protein
MRNVEVQGRDGTWMCLRPLDTKCVDGDELDGFALRTWSDVIVVDEIALERPRPGLPYLAWGTLVCLVLLAGSSALVVTGIASWPLVVGVATAGVLALLTTLVIPPLASLWRKHRSDGDDPINTTFGGDLIDWFRSEGGQLVYLLLSGVIAVVLPAAAIFFAADGLQLIHLVTTSGISNDQDVVITVIGRIMQVFFVAIASILPALLYFLFDREHLNTLRKRFYRQIMRFDPTVRTKSDVIAKYGSQINEAYGRDPSGKILPGRRSPLLLATLAISLGWTFTLLHGDVFIIHERGIASLFEPRQTAVSYGFMGAYFYGINAILRGYVRRDLRPKTYSTLTVRFFIVVVLAWVLELILQSSTLYVIAFLAGIVPETALLLIRESVRKSVPSKVSLIEEEPDPLTKLEGIDLYDRARLFDEGVTNVENLAHHDVVELMLQTRIPVPRLVDWLDQAILYLHAGPRAADALPALRRYGIRTATDLDGALRQAAKRGHPQSVEGILGRVPNGGPGRLRVIHDALDDEEWIVNVRQWRKLDPALLKPLRLRTGDSSGLGQESGENATHEPARPAAPADATTADASHEPSASLPATTSPEAVASDEPAEPRTPPAVARTRKSNGRPQLPRTRTRQPSRSRP